MPLQADDRHLIRKLDILLRTRHRDEIPPADLEQQFRLSGKPFTPEAKAWLERMAARRQSLYGREWCELQPQATPDPPWGELRVFLPQLKTTIVLPEAVTDPDFYLEGNSHQIVHYHVLGKPERRVEEGCQGVQSFVDYREISRRGPDHYPRPDTGSDSMPGDDGEHDTVPMGLVAGGLNGLSTANLWWFHWMTANMPRARTEYARINGLRHLGIRLPEVFSPLLGTDNLLSTQCRRDSYRKMIDFRRLLTAFEGYQGFQAQAYLAGNQGFQGKWVSRDRLELSDDRIRLTLTRLDRDPMIAELTLLPKP